MAPKILIPLCCWMLAVLFATTSLGSPIDSPSSTDQQATGDYSSSKRIGGPPGAYSFGLGKRAGPPNHYGFGLGKRIADALR